MSEADGSIVFSVELDDADTQKKLTTLTKKIDSLNDNVSKNKALKLPLVEQAEKLGAQLDAAKAKLDAMQRSGSTTEAVKAQQEIVNSLQNEWNKVNNQIDAYDRRIKADTQEIEWSTNEAGKLAKRLSEAGYSAEEIKNGVEKADKSAKGFASRMKKLAASALVFSVIAQALRGFRDWIGDVVKVTPEASAAVAKLKGALLTMVQPLVNIIIPAFTTLVNVLTAVIGKLAQFFSFLAGTSAESSAQAAEALNEQTEALNGTGSAAKKAGKSLASFDEINKLSSSNESGSRNESITPDFSVGDIDFLSNRIAALAEDIKAIFSDVKSFVSNIFSGDWDDAIQNIFDFCNDVSALLRDLLSTADEIFGDMIDKIIEKFGLAETPIGEMLEGIKGMVHNTVEMINAVANGSFSDFIAALAGFVDSLRTFVNGAVDFVKKVINSLLDWLDDKTNGRLADIIGTVRLFVNGMIEAVKRMFNGLTDFLVGTFTGDWDRALDGLYDLFAGFLNGAITVVEGAINIIITAINWVTSQINSLLSIDVPDWVPVFGGKSWSPNIQPIPLKQFDRIPALAQGAVIPPNREFLAVLGDQKSGTNIETPLPTMIQAFKQALADIGYNGKSEAYLMLDDIQLGKVIYRLNKSESNRIGVSLVEV